MVIFLEFSVQVQHAGWEIFFVYSFNVLKVQLKFTVQLRLINGSCIYTVYGLVHERLKLVFDIVFEKLFRLDSNFHKFFFNEMKVQISDDISGSLDIGINESFMNVAFSLFKADLAKLEGYFHVNCLTDNLIFCPIVPMGDSAFV